MPVKFAFQTKGLSTLLDSLSTLGRSVEGVVDQRLEDSAKTIVANAKSAAPRATGDMVNATGYVKNGSMSYEIFVRKHYAPYVEFGTGTKVDVPKGLEDYAIQFKIGPGVNLPAHPFLFPAYEQERKELMADLRKVVAQNTRGITVIAPR